jgi:hypothetical protein
MELVDIASTDLVTESPSSDGAGISQGGKRCSQE